MEALQSSAKTTPKGEGASMGHLIYDSSTQISFPDRVLAHVEVVVISKLRRRECFAISWREAAEIGDGRSTIWCDPSIPLRFRFEGSRQPIINREWAERMVLAAASSTGLVITDEDGSVAIGTTHERGI
jgi:hypothetical protein